MALFSLRAAHTVEILDEREKALGISYNMVRKRRKETRCLSVGGKRTLAKLQDRYMLMFLRKRDF